MHDSPVVDTEKPVSRQQELAMREYWGPLACWVNSEFFLSQIPTGAKYPVHTAEDPHLRSTLHMLGYHVWASDGDFGILEGFVMDEASWHLGYLLSMSVGDYIGGRLSSLYESLPLSSLFGIVAAFCLLVGGALVFLLKPMRRLMGDVN